MLAILAGCCAVNAAEEKLSGTAASTNRIALTPSQVFDRVKDSVVVVKTFNSKGESATLGSGVLLPSGKIGTNCHVVKNGASFQVGGGKKFVSATLWGGDEDKDICLLEANELNAKPAKLGHAARLKVGEPVYAVGAPQGLELSLSNGIVSQLRGGPPPFIQTTAAISHGSSGGGLFDAEGRLVGFTTLYVEGGQSLNFAMPVEWAGEIQAGMKASQGRSEVNWNKRAIALQRAKNWTGMRDWCQKWTQAQPENGAAWFGLGGAYYGLQNYAEAIEAYRQALRVNSDDSHSWASLGVVYTVLQRHTDAIEAYRQAVRIDPENANAWALLAISYTVLQRHTESIDASRQAIRIDPERGPWYTLGGAYYKLHRYAEAIEAYRQAIQINPDDSKSWIAIGAVYTVLQYHNDAIEAYSQAVRINPKDSNALEMLAISYADSGNRTEALKVVQQLRRVDPPKADELFNLIMPR